jgi:hypothetical protein
MPTPDDATMVSPSVEHESITGRTTCPPEESRILTTTTHELNEARNSASDSNASSAPHVPMQQPTPPQDSPTRAQTPTDTHSKPSSTDIEAPSRDIPTPMTATDDGTEERTSQASPISTTAPVSLLAHHLLSPFPAHRVRYSRSTCSTMRIMRVVN